MCRSWMCCCSCSALFFSHSHHLLFEIAFRIFCLLFNVILFFIYLSWCGSFLTNSSLISLILQTNIVLTVFFSFWILYLMFITRFGWLSIKRSFLFYLWYRLHFVWYITLIHPSYSIYEDADKHAKYYINCSWNCHTLSIAIRSHQPQFLRCISVFCRLLAVFTPLLYLNFSSHSSFLWHFPPLSICDIVKYRSTENVFTIESI